MLYNKGDLEPDELALGVDGKIDMHLLPRERPSAEMVGNLTELDSFRVWITETFPLYGKKDLEPDELPLGVDGKADMRLFPRERPAAKMVGNLIEEAKGQVGCYLFPAVSGSGKTSAVFELARKYFVLYFGCPLRRTDSSPKPKSDVSILEFLAREVKKRNKSEDTDEARRICAALLVSHLYLLYHFLTLYPDGTPFQFLMCQLNTDHGLPVVKKAFESLCTWTMRAVQSFASTLRNAIAERLLLRLIRDVVLLAIDEMDDAAIMMEYRFISRRKSLFGHDVKRALLTPLLQAAGDFSGPSNWNLLVTGKTSVLDNLSWIEADTGMGPMQILKMEQFFPVANKGDVHQLLMKLLKLDPAVIEADKEVSKYLCNARFGLLANTIEQFTALEGIHDNSIRLQTAVLEAVEEYKLYIQHSYRQRVYIDSTFGWRNKIFADYVHGFYLSAFLLDGTFVDRRFVDREMGHTSKSAPRKSIERNFFLYFDLVRVNNIDNKFHVLEQFGLEVLQDFFFDRPEDPEEAIAFKESVEDLERVISVVDPFITGKGDLFKSIIFYTLSLYKGKSVAELPFVDFGSDNAAKEYWSKVEMNIQRIVRDCPLPRDEADFLVNSSGTLFSPSKLHGADGLAMFESGQLLSISAKLCCLHVPSKVAERQYISTDPQYAYEVSVEEGQEESAAGARANWEHHYLHEKVAFRIHFNFPVATSHGRKYLYCGTTVQSNQCLVVNIDSTDRKKFFSVIEDKELRETIYRLFDRVEDGIDV